jgi:hypothetical protein
MPLRLECTFSSDISIEDSSQLSTMAVFYDRVWLPHPMDCDPDSPIGACVLPMGGRDDKYRAWKEKNTLLFGEGLLETLPPPIDRRGDHGWTDEQEDELMALLATEFRKHGFGYDQGYDHKRPYPLLGRVIALGIFAAYSKKPAPELFSPGTAMSETYALAGLIARPAFEFVLPALGKLNPEQILELRVRVRDTKEAFVHYLAKFTGGLEARIKSGEDPEVEARKIFQREVHGEYYEFTQQLDAERTGIGSKIADIGGKLLKIEAAITTPKFYGEVFEIVAEAFGIIEAENEDKEELPRSISVHQYDGRLRQDRVPNSLMNFIELKVNGGIVVAVTLIGKLHSFWRGILHPPLAHPAFTVASVQFIAQRTLQNSSQDYNFALRKLKLSWNPRILLLIQYPMKSCRCSQT